MIRGLYTSALGMTTQMKKLDVVANNIANCNTNSFKRDIVVTKSFSEELMNKLENDIELEKPIKILPVGNFTYGLSVDSIFTNFETGSLQKTDNKLDLAILGDGFFSVIVEDKNKKEERYTRDGSFALSEDRVLTTKDGHKIMGKKGYITIPDGDISIDNKGKIYVNGNLIDEIKMVSFENKADLRKLGNNLYDIINKNSEKPFMGDIKQGYLETSNVNTVKEMVEMISLSRAYEANQHCVSIHDTVLNKTVNDIAKK